MGTVAISPLRNCKCPFCKNRGLSCTSYKYGVDTDGRPLGLIPPDMYFERSYFCSYCRAELKFYTIVDTLDITELLRKDKAWLESLKSEKNN